MKTLKSFLFENDDGEHHASVIPLTGFAPFSHMGHAKDLGHALKKLPGTKHVGISKKADVYSPEERSHILHRQWKQPDLKVHHSSSGGEVVSNAYHALPKKGKKVLHILVGHDRKEFAHGLKKSLEDGKIKEMNGHKWDEIHVHHPEDSVRSHGMSGTNLRKAAHEGNIKEFHKHLGSMFSRKEAEEHMHRVKTAIDNKQIKLKRETVDIQNELFLNFLTEGVHDHGIFKAVFLAGGPGSGKDYVMKNTLHGHGLTEINSDKAFEYLMDKEGLSKKMPESEEEKRNFIRQKAKNTTELKHYLALMGRNGIIINGTGHDIEKNKKIKDQLEKLGYETSMVMVNTRDDVSQQRNIERGQQGGRTVPESVRKQSWDKVQANRPHYANLFKGNYTEFDNSEDLRTAHPDVVKSKQDEMQKIFKNTQKFVGTPPKNEVAQNWVISQMQKKDRLPVDPQGSEKAPHPDAPHAKKAAEAGLQYYGYGRYGKNGKITHRAIHGRLTSVEKFKDKENKNLNESYAYSDNSSYNALNLGHVPVYYNEKPQEYIINNELIHQIRETRLSGRKITLDEIRKKPCKESIDKGIESGMAMNSYSKEVLNKKGKATPLKSLVAMNELTGDETGYSIGDQKENELKQQGLNLKSFKGKILAKKFVG